MNRKTILSIVLTILLICLINVICKNNKDRNQFKEDYCVSSSFIVVDTNLSFSPYENENIIINFETGSIESVTFENDTFSVGNSNVFSDRSNIYATQNGKLEKLFSSDLIICSKPVTYNNFVFFIAKEPNNDEYHIFEYNGKEVELFYNAPVARDSIAIYDDTVFFEEKHESISWIKSKNISTEEVNIIVKGKNFCWKDPGKSFFFETDSNALAIYDIESKSIEILNYEIKMSCAPIYDCSENILLMLKYDNGRDWGMMIPELTIYYLDKNEYIYLPIYFKNMGFEYFDGTLTFSISNFYLN